MNKDQANRIIDELGGTTVVAQLCEIKPPSVSEWRNNGIPKPWVRYFACLRPDLFDEPKNPPTA
jgi:hypothetical protein